MNSGDEKLDTTGISVDIDVLVSTACSSLDQWTNLEVETTSLHKGDYLLGPVL